jgi:hypothetical protein
MPLRVFQAFERKYLCRQVLLAIHQYVVFCQASESKIAIFSSNLAVPCAAAQKSAPA